MVFLIVLLLLMQIDYRYKTDNKKLILKRHYLQLILIDLQKSLCLSYPDETFSRYSIYSFLFMGVLFPYLSRTNFKNFVYLVL